MPELLVDPAAVSAASLRLGTIAGDIDDAHARLHRHLGAGHRTPAADALHDLQAHFAALLPHYAQASARLASAVGDAAAAYHRTDAGVASTCDPGTVAR